MGMVLPFPRWLRVVHGKSFDDSMEYGKQKTSATALVSSEILQVCVLQAVYGRILSQSENLCFLVQIPSVIFDCFLLMNGLWVKLKVFRSEGINQEEHRLLRLNGAPRVVRCLAART